MSIGAEKTIQMVYNIRKMFDDCGWEYMQDFFGYSYFRKAVAEDSVAEEIFCDEESRFQMMQRVIKGRMLPLLILFFTVLLPQFISCLFYTHYYCKCQYKNVAFLSYKNVGKPTRLYDIFCILIFLNHVLHLIF